jgi:hypothetical protein
MTALRSSVPTDIHPYELEETELLAIGRLVRATAYIEYLVTLYLCKLADITEGKALVLLGRMQPSARLKLAETFAETKGKPFLDLHREAFDNEHYHGLITCRNTAVHGFLLGKTDNGRIAFVVQEPAGTDSNKVYQTVRAYMPGDFADAATVAEGVIPQIINRFELRPLLDKRRAQALSAHPKAHRQQAKPKVKR